MRALRRRSVDAAGPSSKIETVDTPDRSVRMRRLASTVVLLLAACTSVFAAEPPTIVGVRLGLGDQYKLGSWAPVRVAVEGGSEPVTVTVVVVAPDADSVGVATTPPAGRPLAAEPGRVAETVLYTRVGKYDAPIEIRLVAGSKTLDRAVVEAGDPAATDRVEIAPATTATQRLVAELGADAGVAQLIADPGRDPNEKIGEAPVFARVVDASKLPRDALGYDSFDAVVLSAGRGGWMADLSAGDPRIAALEQWVRGGGRLIVSCGAEGVEALAADGPLAPFAPGRFDRVVPLPRTDAIEGLAESLEADSSADRIDLEGGELMVSRLADVSGVVEAYDGPNPKTLPLVVRSPLGFGEVTFVAFDLDQPALAGWPGRVGLLRQLLGPRFRERDNSAAANGFGYYNWNTDYVSTLIRRLDGQFSGVGSTPFLAVVGLVIGYLLLIGPGDYFLVKRVIGRVEATWITFPLIVVLTSVGAYAAARWLKGDDLLVNQIEWIDVDAIDGRARGTLLTHLFSPAADRYDLGLTTRGPDGQTLAPDQRVTAWLGNPGYGLGGMLTPATSRVGWRPDYAIDPTPLVTSSVGGPGESVLGLPVQVWSTKTLLSRWSAALPSSVSAAVRRNRDGLAEGQLTNDTGVELRNCRFLYGDWALRMGDIAPGESAEVVAAGRSLVRISTLLGATGRSDDEWRAVTTANRSIAELAQSLTMLGHESLRDSGAATALGHCDLSHHLDAGRALLLAEIDGARSGLTRRGEPLVDDDKRRSWVFVRFILGVEDGA